MMTIKEILNDYIPFNAQEQKDKELFLKSLSNFNDILTRQNEFCHATSSAIILNKTKDKTLCIFHNIYNSWAWTGGHADGDEDMQFVALKEAHEETSIQNLKLLLNLPISIEALAVDGHFRRGKYVSAHIHLNFTYLLQADENDLYKIKEDENSGVAWLTFDELINKSTEPNMIKVYKKIFEKIKVLKII